VTAHNMPGISDYVDDWVNQKEPAADGPRDGFRLGSDFAVFTECHGARMTRGTRHKSSFGTPSSPLGSIPSEPCSRRSSCTQAIPVRTGSRSSRACAAATGTAVTR
jgi:hypothetical protein